MEIRALGDRAARRTDDFVWATARAVVDAVRYRPLHTDLVLACGVSQPDVPRGLVRWLADVRWSPGVVTVRRLPHAMVRAVASRAAAYFGPTASAFVRWLSGAVAARVDSLAATAIERPLRVRAHPGLLVPHPHDVAILAADMRGFSNLTVVMDDTQRLTDLIGEYLSALTTLVERHRGIVFQYTGDGLLAVFLPELAGLGAADMFQRLVDELCPALHRTFDALHEGWRAEWRARGQEDVTVGLGVGLSFGRATIGFIGPSGKKQVGVLGPPANLAAFLCAEAEAGTVMIDRGSFARAGVEAPEASSLRLLSRKLRRRIEVLLLRYGDRQTRSRPRQVPLSAQ